MERWSADEGRKFVESVTTAMVGSAVFNGAFLVLFGGAAEGPLVQNDDVT